jgi:glycosyltransferase 2 family protein
VVGVLPESSLTAREGARLSLSKGTRSLLRKHLKFIALVVLAALILWWFGRGLNWAEVRQSLGQANAPLLLASIAVVCLTYLLRAFRWRALLAPLTPASLRELFVATTVGFGAVFLFGRAGEVVRPVVLPLRDRRVRPAASFVTIMVERLCDMVAVVILFSANLLWFRAPGSNATELMHVREAGVILLVLVLIGVACLVWFERHSHKVTRWLDGGLAGWKFVPGRLRHAVVSTLEQLATALQVLAHPRELLVTATWTILLWLAIILANALVIRAFGLPFGFSETVFVLGWALVGSLVPTPGGAAGAFHAATAAGLIFLGVAREQAAAVSIIIHLVDFAPAVLFGLYYLLRGDIQIKRLRELTSPEAVEHAVEDEKIEPAETKVEDELQVVGVGK